MGTLAWAYLVVATLFGVALLVWRYEKYKTVQREFERDLGWHLTWHERIYEPEDESGPGDASPLADGDAC